MTVVVDASVVVAGLVSADATGVWAESVLAGEPLAAPHLMPVEAASILHRAELAGEISADAASLAHADLRRLRVEYFPYDPFAERIWELRSPGLAAPPGSPERARLFFPPGPADSGTDHPAETFDSSYQQQIEMLQKESDRRRDEAHTALAQGREDLARAALQQRAGLQGQLNDLQEQYAMLQRLRRGAADCDTSARRVELQMTALAESSGELERRADEARGAGQPDLAQESLARKNAVEAELGELRNQHQSLRQQADRLAAASQRLQAQIIDYRLRQKEAGERSGRPGLTSYEAWYVALAEFLGAKVATLDTRLALMPGPRCGFCLPPPGETSH
jgi:predicted nucleic acid-binding protein